jgi:hypothetical protein
MKITDQITSPDRDIIVVINDQFDVQVSEFLEHVQDRINLTFVGTGTPESVVTAVVGATYRRLDGGANTTLYVKESGTSNTGWVAK